jgi:hypothetical protein
MLTALAALAADSARTQSTAAPNSQPNPYKLR